MDKLKNKKKNVKEVDRALADVRKAILKTDKKNIVKKAVKRKKINKPKKAETDVLLLTEVYNEFSNTNNLEKEKLIYKKNIKNLIRLDTEKWFKKNFSSIAKDYTRDTIKSLNNKNY